MIDSLFPEAVATAAHRPEDWTKGLLPEEEPFVAKAVTKRIRSFTAGRNCARRALAQLGVPKAPLLISHTRAPIWPKGVIGSISHCADWCGAATVRVGKIRSIGFDVELSAPLDVDLRRLICTPMELNADRDAATTGLDTHKLIFSAKESVFKACHPITGEMLDFLDVSLTFDFATGTFSARRVNREEPLVPARSLIGRFCANDTHVFTGAWIV